MTSIRYNEISGLGMIFLRREDPVNEFVMALSNYRYNLVGFYYETRASGSKQVKVLITDLSDVGTGQWLPSLNLREILSDHLITDGIIRPFIDQDIGLDKTTSSTEVFREILARTVSSNLSRLDDRLNRNTNDADKEKGASQDRRGPKESTKISPNHPPGDDFIREWLWYLLDHNIDKNTGNLTSISLINNTIIDISTTMTQQNKDPDDSEDEDNHDNLTRDIKYRYLLLDLGLFDKPIKIHLPSTRRKTLNRYLTEGSVLIKSLCLNFARLYLEDRNFRQKFLKHIHDDNPLKISRTHDMIIQNLMGSGEHFVDYIQSSLIGGDIDPTNMIDLLEKYDHDANAASSAFSVERVITSRENPVRPDLIRLVRTCPPELADDPDVSPTKLLSFLHDRIGQMVGSVLDGDAPLIHINELSDAVNSIVKMSGLHLDEIPLIEGETSHPASIIITTGHKAGIPMRISNDRKIILSLSGENISEFSHDDLREILTILDVISDGDNRFDDLRAKIVVEIAN